MQAYLLNAGATITCPHGGLVQSIMLNTRVLVGGQPILLQPAPVIVSDCPFVTPAGNLSPCLTASWLTAATRITSNGMPVLLDNSIGISIPNTTPLMISNTQKRVSGI